MLQLEMIGRVKENALKEDAISAVLMYGSFIKGEGDRYSDIEFYVFVKDGKSFDKKEWVSRIEPYEVFFRNEHGTDVVIFDNLIRGEFHFLSAGEIGIVKSWEGLTTFEYADKMNLADKDGLLAGILSSIQPKRPVQNTTENIEWLALSLINNLLYARNLLCRGEFAHTHQLFYTLQKYLLWLIRINSSSEKHWESPTKKLEKDIPVQWIEKYRHCIPTMEETDLKEKLENTFTLSEELFGELKITMPIKSLLRRIRESE